MNNNQQKQLQKGVSLALITALISGVSIFINKFAVVSLKDPFIFTFGKNIITALVLFSGLLLIRKIKDFKKLKIKDWLFLLIIGIIGGSIPFLLFFKALSLTQAPMAAFMHKTLFIWVAILAIPLLKEKLSKVQFLALGVLLFGNILIGGISNWQFSWPELLVLIATILWTFETILVKKVIKNIDYQILAFSRMFFGSIFMLIYLLATSKIAILGHLNSIQIIWIFVTAGFLIGYVTFWYASLKFAPASVVTSILVLGSPITTLLNSIFITHQLPSIQGLGIMSVIIGVIIFILWPLKKTNIRIKEAY